MYLCVYIYCSFMYTSIYVCVYLFESYRVFAFCTNFFFFIMLVVLSGVNNNFQKRTCVTERYRIQG